MTNLNRRDVLKLLAGFATTAAGVAPMLAATTVGASAQTGKLSPPPLDGELRFDEEARAAAADDFGHIVHKTPEGVLLPGSDQDVATAIRWAGKLGRKIAPQGQSHSVYGRAQAHGGIVIDMSRLHTVHAVQGDQVVVEAGAKWSEVLAATLPRGLTPPVLAGLGQVAIITRATLKLIPAPEQVRRYLLTYPDLRTLLADERLLAADDGFDALQGAVLPTPAGWKYQLDVASSFSGNNPPNDDALLAGLSDDRSTAEISTLPYFGYLNRLAMLEQNLRSNGQWFYPHPWLTTFVGDSKIESVVSDELARLTPADLGAFGQVVLSAFRRQAVTSPLLRLPERARQMAIAGTLEDALVTIWRPTKPKWRSKVSREYL